MKRKKTATKVRTTASAKTTPLCPRLRIIIDEEYVLGPGKIALIEAIGRTGSISGAGRELEMSYRRAWLLVDALNRMFKTPVVSSGAGGEGGGGARVTLFGRRVAEAYKRADERAREAIEEEFSKLNVRVR